MQKTKFPALFPLMAYVSVNCGTAGTGGEVWPGDGGTGGQERGVARVGTGDGGTGDR